MRANPRNAILRTLARGLLGVLTLTPLLEAHPSQDDWRASVESLAERIATGEADSAAADELYPQLVAAFEKELDEYEGIFRRARRASDLVCDLISVPEGKRSDETVSDHYATLVDLHLARLRLLELVGPELHAEITSAGSAGTEGVKLELDYLLRDAHYQRLGIPAGLQRMLHNLKMSPLSALRRLLLAVLSLVAFHSWRKWAEDGIQALRDFVRSALPRSGKAFAAFLWYVARVRRPLEWLILFSLLFSMIDAPGIEQAKGVLWIAAVWILLTWFAVLLVDALATRATSPGKLERSPLRLRSLGILASWVVVIGLGLHLASRLVGRGTIYAWVWELHDILFLPIALSLLVIWRPEIRTRLEREAVFSARVKRVLGWRKGRFGLPETIVGIGYLLVLRLGRLALKLVRKTALGRTLVAEGLRQRMVRTRTDLPEKAEQQSIDPDLRRRWVQRACLLDAVVEEELGQALDMLHRGWPLIAIVAPRGGGKASFLESLLSRFGGRTVSIQTPRGRAEDALAALGHALGLGESSDAEAIAAALRREEVGLVAWENVHRLAKPTLGGQAELDRTSGLLTPWIQGIPMVVTVDSTAWHYLSSVREGRLAEASNLELPAWTEGQIGELIERRAEEVGIVLNYHRLSFPRLLLEQEFESPEQGLRACFRRLLWGEADGNPSSALRLVIDALIVERDGTYSVQLPRTPAVGDLEGAELATLFVLRFLLQTDGASAEDIVAGLSYSEGTVRNSLRTALMRGWIEDQDGRCLVTWKWLRTITRALERRNLVASTRHRATEDGSLPEIGRVRRHERRPFFNAPGAARLRSSVHLGYRGVGR